MRGEAAGRRKEHEEGCDASVRDCGVAWAGGRSMMHGEAETGLAEVSWACKGNGCGSRGAFRIGHMDLYLFELTTYLFQFEALIRSNCATSNFDLVASCAFSIKSIPLPIMSTGYLSQPDHGASYEGDSSSDIELFPGEKRYKAMRHNQSNLALPLQDAVLFLLPTSHMLSLIHI